MPCTFYGLVLSLAFAATSAIGQRDDQSGHVLTKAAQGLMDLPLPQNGQQYHNAYEVRPPQHSDLAISRLQSKALTTVDDLWHSLNDPQRLALFGQGVAKQVLKIFAQEMQGDVFALGQRESDVQKELKGLVFEEGQGGGGDEEEWRKTYETLQKVTGKINLLYSYLDGYMSGPDEVSSAQLEDYARSIVEPGSGQDTSLETALVQLHNLSMPHLGLREPGQNGQGANLLGATQRQDVFFKLFLIVNGKNGEHLCTMGQSPHQLIYNLYNIIALTEIKGYAMIQFSYMMLKLYNRGNFNLESDLARRSFEAQATDKLLAVKGILPNMSRDYWRCDPARHNEGQTYVRMTELLQGVIENEVDLNQRQSCKDKCSSYKVAETHSCFKNLFCAKQRRCDGGRLFDCQFFDADAWVCMSQKMDRRYDWVEYEDNTLLGSKGQCPNKIKVDSWWRWLMWHCSYCLCKCDAPGPRSDRYWSLRSVMANATENKIVTGVRFVKKNRVIQLEIEEAVALPEGSVLEESRTWRDVPPMSLEKAERDTDYMQMSYEQRSLDTDRLEAPPGHVVTGVKLRNLGGHLNLEVQVTPIVFTTGQLSPERSTWIGNDNTPATANRRRQKDIWLPGVPTEQKGGSMVLSVHNQYIQFDATSARKDVMQTTIPFVDAQPVSPTSGTWLSGVGLYYKGRTGSGGFVGLMIQSLDYSRHLLPERGVTKEELTFDFNKLAENESESEREARKRKKGIR